MTGKNQRESYALLMMSVGVLIGWVAGILIYYDAIAGYRVPEPHGSILAGEFARIKSGWVRFGIAACGLVIAFELVSISRLRNRNARSKEQT